MAARYPSRESHFAHRFVRVLQKSCAAQDIGRDAVLLLCFISHTEDAARYSGPVRFWNEQLMSTMGFTSPKQLNNARKRACEAGWLVYDRGGTREVGEYFVTIPNRFSGVSDAPIEESILSPTGMNSGTNHPAFIPSGERIAERKGDELRNEKVTESGKPSIPSPIPIPIPNSCSEGDARPSPPTQPQIDAQSVSYPFFPVPIRQGVIVSALAALCLQYCEDQWTAAHATPEQAAAMLTEQFRRAVLQELQLIEITCVEVKRSRKPKGD